MDCTNLVSWPRYREEIDYVGIELAAGKFQMGSSHPHRQSKIGKDQDFTETFQATQQTSSQRSRSRHDGGWHLGLLWKPEIQNMGRRWRETTNSAQTAYGCKGGHVLGAFHPIRIIKVIVLPPGGASDRFFFVDNVLDSLKKKLAKFPCPNPERDHFYIWIMPDSIWPIMQFRQITSPRCPIQLTAQIWLRETSSFLGIWKVYWQRVHSKRWRTARKGDGYFDVNLDIDFQSSIWGMEKLIAPMLWSRWRVSLETHLFNVICISQEETNPGTRLLAPPICDLCHGKVSTLLEHWRSLRELIQIFRVMCDMFAKSIFCDSLSILYRVISGSLGIGSLGAPVSYFCSVEEDSICECPERHRSPFVEKFQGLSDKSRPNIWNMPSRSCLPCSQSCHLRWVPDWRLLFPWSWAAIKVRVPLTSMLDCRSLHWSVKTWEKWYPVHREHFL
jgi:hypothetical protein